MSIEKEFHFEDPFMSPPVIRPSPRLHSVPMLFPNIAALLPRATFQQDSVAEDPSMNLSCNPPAIRPSPKATFRPHVAPRHCRAAPSGDIPCPNCSPRVSCDTLRRRFMPLSFPKRVARHPRATFHALIVPQACRVAPSGDISCFNCSPSVSCDTLERSLDPFLFLGDGAAVGMVVGRSR